MNKTAFKHGEGAKPVTEPVWPEPGSLPPVGAECRYIWVEGGGYRDGVCVAHYEGAAVICDLEDDGAERRYPHQIKPIQTGRDKLINLGEKDIKSKSPEIDRSVIAALIDAGWRPTK